MRALFCVAGSEPTNVKFLSIKGTNKRVLESIIGVSGALELLLVRQWCKRARARAFLRARACVCVCWCVRMSEL